MIYNRISDNEVINLIESFNCNGKKIGKSCIVTDGTIEEIDKDFYPIDHLNKSKNTLNIFYLKKVDVKNANYISEIFYILDTTEINGKWILNDAVHRVNEKFNLINEIKFIMCHNLIPLDFILDEEPGYIIVNVLK